MIIFRYTLNRNNDAILIDELEFKIETIVNIFYDFSQLKALLQHFISSKQTIRYLIITISTLTVTLHLYMQNSMYSIKSFSLMFWKLINNTKLKFYIRDLPLFFIIFLNFMFIRHCLNSIPIFK